MKQETIPRLELLAALILARLISHVGEALEPEVDITYLYYLSRVKKEN